MKSHPYFNDFRLKWLAAQELVRMAYRAMLFRLSACQCHALVVVTLGNDRFGILRIKLVSFEFMFGITMNCVYSGFYVISAV